MCRGGVVYPYSPTGKHTIRPGKVSQRRLLWPTGSQCHPVTPTCCCMCLSPSQSKRGQMCEHARTHTHTHRPSRWGNNKQATMDQTAFTSPHDTSMFVLLALLLLVSRLVVAGALSSMKADAAASVPSSMARGLHRTRIWIYTCVCVLVGRWWDRVGLWRKEWDTHFSNSIMVDTVCKCSGYISDLPLVSANG